MFYCEYVKKVGAREPLRVMFTTGDEVVDAKHADVMGDFPPYIPMDKDRGINLINDIFSGEARGLGYEEVRAAKETGEAAATHIKSHLKVTTAVNSTGKKVVVAKKTGAVKKQA